MQCSGTVYPTALVFLTFCWINEVAGLTIQTWHVIIPMQRPISVAKRRAVSADTALLIPYGYVGMLLLPS